MFVIKRNNSLVDFDLNKIKVAISKAMKECDKYDKADLDKVVEKIDNEISDWNKEYNEDLIHIEDIQNIIENQLMKNGLTEVAKAYILYRDNRRKIRDEQAHLYKESQDRIKEIIEMKNIENANANVDEGSFSGKNAKITSYFLKEYALNNLIDKEVAKAHREGRLYTHDLDSYCCGQHNCLFIDFQNLFDNNKGFETRNGDVRKPNDIMTFFQLVAVVFQCESQVQYGGVGANKIDYDAAPYVAITFRKTFVDALVDLRDITEQEAKKIVESIKDKVKLESSYLKDYYPKEYEVAKRHTIKKTMQGAESLYHNLNTLESRAGSQVPFTSINFGTDTSPEGRLVSKSLLQASINGIGKFHRTSIFPISIFKYKKGINDKKGTPNYDLKLLAIESLSKRIYPNFCNVDISYQKEINCPDDEFSTMGCRTTVGKDINGLGWSKGGRGNISPVTINLVDIGIKNGICLGERNKADIEGFWKDLDNMLKLSEKALLDRYEWICSQKAKSGFFLHQNGLMKNTIGRKLNLEEDVRESMKHGTLAIGYIGIAETMVAMFGETQTNNDKIYDFAYKIVERIYNFTKECTERNSLNFSCYATPAENCCKTLRNDLVKRYGVIKGVTDKKYITNSHHIPVYDEITIKDKIDKEAPFSKLATGGNIMYVELESSMINNLKAIEKMIDYAMSKDVSYFALNFPIDTCMNCGYSSEINDKCPECGSKDIERLRRVTGYLTTDYRKFNEGKIEEVHDRVRHSLGEM
jgi:ribonucleoside-triphosphate reductase